jgi:tRNA pseudouridine55 synthase
MVSAIRVGGRRLYELARAGEEVERAPRTVTVARFEVSAGSEPGTVRIEVDCSSGTYVRSLAADLGAALGGVAHLRNLVRTRIGPFGLDGAWGIDAIGAATLRPPAELVAHLETVEADDATAVMVGHGRVLDRRELGVSGEGPWTVAHGGRLLAVYASHHDGRAKPMLVYASERSEPRGRAGSAGGGGAGSFDAMGSGT